MHAVVLGTDENYLSLACIAVTSICESNPEPPDIFIFTIDASSSGIARAKRYLSNFTNKVRFVEVSDADCGEGIAGKRQTRAAFLRLAIGTLLPREYTRAVYLDCDVRVAAPLESLFQIDLQGKTAGCCHDIFGLSDPEVGTLRRNTGLRDDQSYFNSGVMLIDLERWRSLDIGYQARTFAEQYPERCLYVDQCALNAVLADDWLAIDQRWNYQPYLRDIFSWRTLNQPNDQGFVYHFPGIKPWVEVPFYSVLEHHDWYCRAAEKSPWDNFAVPIATFERWRLYLRYVCRMIRVETRRLLNVSCPMLLSRKTREGITSLPLFDQFLQSQNPFRLLASKKG